MMNEEPDPTRPPGTEDSTQPEDQDQEGYYEPAPKFARAIDYMETEKGHEVTLRFVTFLEQLLPALKMFLEAKVESHRVQPRLEFRKWVLLLVVRLLVFIVAVGALIYMRRTGSIDPSIALLIGGLVAYFFGYNRSQQ
jgi:hypothetical protein